ncbi:Nuclear envelope pore membrane protein POM 121, partial [Manis javanica]
MPHFALSCCAKKHKHFSQENIAQCLTYERSPSGEGKLKIVFIFRVYRTSPQHFGITRPRQYPIQQAQYSCVLPTLCRNGGHSEAAAQIPKAPEPWSKEAVLLTLERWKRKKRTVEEEEDQTSVAGQEEKRRIVIKIEASSSLDRGRLITVEEYYQGEASSVTVAEEDLRGIRL